MKVRIRAALVDGAGLVFFASLVIKHWPGYEYPWLIWLRNASWVHWLRDASWVLMMIGFWFTYRDQRHIPPTPNQTLGLHAFIAVYLGAAIFYNRESWLALICLVPPFLYVLYRVAFLFREGQRSRRANTPAEQPLS